MRGKANEGESQSDDKPGSSDREVYEEGRDLKVNRVFLPLFGSLDVCHTPEASKYPDRG